jgi:hypothetical protein
MKVYKKNNKTIQATLLLASCAFVLPACNPIRDFMNQKLLVSDGAPKSVDIPADAQMVKETTTLQVFMNMDQGIMDAGDVATDVAGAFGGAMNAIEQFPVRLRIQSVQDLAPTSSVFYPKPNDLNCLPGLMDGSRREPLNPVSPPSASDVDSSNRLAFVSSYSARRIKCETFNINPWYSSGWKDLLPLDSNRAVEMQALRQTLFFTPNQTQKFGSASVSEQSGTATADGYSATMAARKENRSVANLIRRFVNDQANFLKQPEFQGASFFTFFSHYDLNSKLYNHSILNQEEGEVVPSFPSYTYTPGSSTQESSNLGSLTAASVTVIANKLPTESSYVGGLVAQNSNSPAIIKSGATLVQDVLNANFPHLKASSTDNLALVNEGSKYSIASTSRVDALVIERWKMKKSRKVYRVYQPAVQGQVGTDGKYDLTVNYERIGGYTDCSTAQNPNCQQVYYNAAVDSIVTCKFARTADHEFIATGSASGNVCKSDLFNLANGSSQRIFESAPPFKLLSGVPTGTGQWPCSTDLSNHVKGSGYGIRNCVVRLIAKVDSIADGSTILAGAVGNSVPAAETQALLPKEQSSLLTWYAVGPIQNLSCSSSVQRRGTVTNAGVYTPSATGAVITAPVVISSVVDDAYAEWPAPEQSTTAWVTISSLPEGVNLVKTDQSQVFQELSQEVVQYRCGRVASQQIKFEIEKGSNDPVASYTLRPALNFKYKIGTAFTAGSPYLFPSSGMILPSGTAGQFSDAHLIFISSALSAVPSPVSALAWSSPRSLQGYTAPEALQLPTSFSTFSLGSSSFSTGSCTSASNAKYSLSNRCRIPLTDANGSIASFVANASGFESEIYNAIKSSYKISMDTLVSVQSNGGSVVAAIESFGAPVFPTIWNKRTLFGLFEYGSSPYEGLVSGSGILPGATTGKPVRDISIDQFLSQISPPSKAFGSAEAAGIELAEFIYRSMVVAKGNTVTSWPTQFAVIAPKQCSWKNGGAANSAPGYKAFVDRLNELKPRSISKYSNCPAQPITDVLNPNYMAKCDPQTAKLLNICNPAEMVALSKMLEGFSSSNYKLEYPVPTGSWPAGAPVASIMVERNNSKVFEALPEIKPVLFERDGKLYLKLESTDPLVSANSAMENVTQIRMLSGKRNVVR